jgi:hypothetical protein
MNHVKVISSYLSTNNKLPLHSNFELLHDVLVEVNNKKYFIEIKGKDTIDAANKVLKMTESEIQNLSNNKY